MKQHEPATLRYLSRLCDEETREHACRATTPEGVARWQVEARPALRRLLGLDGMAASLAGYPPSVELEPAETLDGFTRRLGRIETEPDVRIPFWLLRPEGPGPFPLAILPHGHENYGLNTYAGVWSSEEHRRKIAAEDRDVAVQAARRGFLAIAPATRGFAPVHVPDLNNRHDRRDCRSQAIHALLAGRTAVGERVWDTERLLEWAAELPEVDSRIVLLMGNSGGGVVTLYAAACNPRFTVAVPSCSFCTTIGRNGLVHHCDCNVVPGILRFGEFHDVAGLIAPRPLLVVNGREDPLFPLDEVERAVAGVRAIYEAAGVPDRFAHRWGEGGHRFYKDLMWQFVLKQQSTPLPSR